MSNQNEFENLCDLEVTEEELALATGGSEASDALAAAVLRTRMINLSRLGIYNGGTIGVTGSWTKA